MSALQSAPLHQSASPAAPEPIDEHTLIAQVRTGSESAFREIFEAYYSPLCAFASAQLHSRAAAQDLVHDLFARLWERRTSWTITTNLKTYLFSAVRHRVMNARRDARTVEAFERVATSEDHVIGMSQHAPSADTLAQHTELSQAFDRAIAELPDRQRAVLFLRLRHHLNNAEVAAVEGMTEKAVEKILNRAFKTLRIKMVAHT